MPDVKIIKATKPDREHKEKLNVAAYCRVSTQSEEQDNSLQLQAEHFTDLIARTSNWINAGIYVEKISGLSDDRPEFNRMIKKCKAGNIDMIIVKSVSRFSRRMAETIHCFQDLMSRNIDVYFEQENRHLLDERAYEAIMMILMIVQNESIAKGKNVRWGIKRSMESGKSGFQNQKCFGYSKDDSGKLMINDEESGVVKLIFNLYLSGESIYGLVNYLGENGYDSPTGKTKWTTGQIQHILTNEKYTGNVLLQKRYVKNTLNHKIVINKGERDQCFIENNHEAIISLEVFNAAQMEMARRSKLSEESADGTKSRYNSKGLGGLIVCEECGRNYTRVTWSRNGQKKIVWRCVNRIEHGKRICKNSPTVLEDDIKQKIISELQLDRYDEKVARQKIEQIIIKSNGEIEISI